MRTKEDILNKQIAIGDKKYLIEEATQPNRLWTWLLPGKSASERGCWNVDSVLALIDSGIWKLIEENNMNEEQIEVGDIVSCTCIGCEFKNVEVIEIDGDVAIFNEPRRGERINLALLKLISKGKKQEIIGYELLKDLPGIPAGTKNSGRAKEGSYNFSSSANTFIIGPEQITDTTWFKPIYKPKEVVVKLSGDREVIIGATHIFLKNQGDIDHESLIKLHDGLQAPIRQVNGYNVKVTSISIGCQEFTKEDIEAVYKAIQDKR